MGKDGGFLTPKAIGNRIKAKGMQKLRWYCQSCEKQCRDEVRVLLLKRRRNLPEESPALARDRELFHLFYKYSERFLRPYPNESFIALILLFRMDSNAIFKANPINANCYSLVKIPANTSPITHSNAPN